MDFHNPKVETAVIEHLRFADRMVTEAIGKPSNGTFGEDLRQQMVIVLLSFTLNKDYRLANSLIELKQSQLPAGTLLEDNIL